MCTLKQGAHKNGQKATLEFAFQILIGIFRTPKWKENHPERLKKVYKISANELRTWTQIGKYS